MSTQKTFKIGLSNTDKQNMAQDVYEKLLALTFPEYDTGATYSVGDFVVYNDQLYKCIGATSGAWDSTKWQLATLNDLLTDIEDAVQFVNDKANVDGNYPTMTVGVADQLSPYDEESGDDQDEPFSFQATGTGNGSQLDFSTGAIALMKEKQGNTVVVNQLNNNDGTNGTNAGITYTKNNDGSWTLSGTASALSYRTIHNNISFVSGHKYLLFTTKSDENVGFYAYNSEQQVYPLAQTYGNSFVFTSSYTLSANLVFIVKNATDLTTALTTKVYLIDLTLWFNGDIPQDLLYNPSNFFRYYQGDLAYNEGTLVNSDGRYIKCIGMNQWDEEWEVGRIDSSGSNYSSSNQIRSKNYIEVIPNATYYFYTPFTSGINISYFDVNKNLIKQDGSVVSTTKTMPSNCCFIRFHTYQTYGETYNNDISINLYYEDKARCLTYEPYEILTNNDTGTETLRSAGNVCDIKLPSGEIKRNVGVVDLGTLSWTKGSGNEQTDIYFYSDGLQSLVKKAVNNSTKANIICPAFTTVSHSQNYTRNGLIGVAITNNGYITCASVSYDSMNTSQFTTAMSGVYLFYELAEPTTEQGTQFSENLVIDDFGSMDFQGTNGVPQGNLIFYPVDYKAFIDTLYKYTEGTPSNIALKSELSADKTELQGVDSQLLANIGGTLRHLINGVEFNNSNVIDLGNLDYTRTGSGLFQANSIVADMKASVDNETPANIVCSKYQTYKFSVMYGPLSPTPGPNMAIAISTTGYIYINDSAYTEVTTFKAAMKGVLLAYEKA